MEEKVSQKDIDWLLNLDKPAGEKYSSYQSSPKKKRPLLPALTGALLVFGLMVLPFFILIRTSVYLNLNHEWNGWIALTGGILLTVILLLIYILVLFRKVKNKKLLFRLSAGGASVMVLGFCLYGLLYLSGVNAKSEEIRNVYRSMHPIMRVAIATTTLADSDVVITDISREPDDYVRMGLPVNQASLHFVQQNGFVHAVDLRTKGHWGIRNYLLKSSLDIMGFETIRHVGTADHLHVSLPLNN